MKFVEIEGQIVFEDGRILGKNGKILSTRVSEKGYVSVNFYVNGKRTTKHLHRILAECFLPNENSLPEVDHINSVRDDNRLENLKWISKSENNQKSYDVGNRCVIGDNNANCKTSEDVVKEICKLIAEGNKPSEIRDMGFDYNLIRAIKSKKNWSHISKDYF